MEESEREREERERELARSILNQLRESLRARSLICYFRNQFAGSYWQFHKNGVFKYECQMHGGVGYPGQDRRMTHGQDNEENGVAYFDAIPEEISSQVLAGVSFVNREGIVHCIRVRLEQNAATGPDKTVAIIFLNYVPTSNFPTYAETQSLVVEQLPTLKDTLFPLIEKPRLDPVSAWRLRSAMLGFRQRLGEILVTEVAKDSSTDTEAPQTSASDELFKLVVEMARQIVRPNRGRNVLCSLNLINANNEVEVRAPWSDPDQPIPENLERGVVHYVGQTGQIYFINDVKEYKKLKPDLSRPKYVEGNPATRSELACPLIIQKKVVGVLNLEADEPGAYDDQHVLMLSYFASSAVLAVRQTMLWNNLRIASHFEITHLGNEEAIFKKTLAAIEDLGYQASIWEFEKKTLYFLNPEDKEVAEARDDGYSSLIREEKIAVALANVTQSTPTQQTFEQRLGNIDLTSGLFTGWSAPQENTELPLNPIFEKLVSSNNSDFPGKVVTHLGFPIFNLEIDKETRQPLISSVRAVLWVRSKRFFLSLLDDDCWCLSLLCRNASGALKVFEDTERRVELGQEARKVVLQYHFGGARAEELYSSMDEEDFLRPVQNDEIIVLNLDIRGSTRLGQSMAKVGQTDLYARLIQQYHDKAQSIIHEFGGVMDKTMGDGIQALFNIYRPGIIVVSDPPQYPQEADAVNCAFQIFDMFADLVSTQRKAWKVTLPDTLRIGAGLAVGSGIVGSFSEQRLRGFDYTVLGDVANHAGKLMNLARTDFVDNCLTKWLSWSAVQRSRRSILKATRKGKWSAVSENGIHKLRKGLYPHDDILIADTAFETIASRSYQIQGTSVNHDCFKLETNPDQVDPDLCLWIVRRKSPR
jgi:class 3 adenylate cyclase/GAF domain-containing protein